MSVLTSQKTDCLYIIKTKPLMLFREVAVDCHSELYNTHTQQVEILYVDLCFELQRNCRNYETEWESLRFVERFTVDF